MKNALKLSTLIACCAVVCACSNKQQEPANEAKKSALPEGYTSPMLLIHDLKGQVTCMVETTYYCESEDVEVGEDDIIKEYTYKFSENGELTSVTYAGGGGVDMKSVVIEYDAKNRISHYAYKNDWMSFDSKYQYDGSNRIVKETEETDGEVFATAVNEYGYNSNSELESNYYSIDVEEETVTGNVFYKVKERDSKGNWTKRYVEDIQDTEEEEGYTTASMVVRKIYYAGDKLPE
ncbi:MAG: hypothetical protein J6Y82_04255 [Bacteroidales bacterium]|nr:hypothetical protein [Bacteroidales bacterium]